MREDANDGLLLVLLLQVPRVGVLQVPEQEEGQDKVEDVPGHAAHVEGVDLRGGGDGVPVVDSGMVLVKEGVDVQLLKVFELVERVVL